MRKEIGSKFWEINVDQNRNNKYWWDDPQYNIEYFISGRNAILGLCKVLSDQEKKIILPSFTCATVIEPFVQEKWEIQYYEVNKDLTINVGMLDSLIREFKPSAILVHSYFGFGFNKIEEEYIRKLRKRNIIVIEDLTQKVFSKNRIALVDYYVFSLRKYLAVPDGGMLVSREKISLELIKENDDLLNTAKSAFELKKSYMQGGDLNLKGIFQKKYIECNELLSVNRVLTKGSKQTLAIYRKTDFEEIKERRRENYNRLCELLKPITYIEVVFEQMDDSVVPLCLPVYVKEGRRKELQKFLSEENIYCPIIWPRCEVIDAVFEDTEYIYNNILCIPIDQRYGIDEMEKIARCIMRFGIKEV